ncbi:MAG: hypothetical protein AB1345_05110 [Chloroflexota bacterium]
MDESKRLAKTHIFLNKPPIYRWPIQLLITLAVFLAFLLINEYSNFFSSIVYIPHESIVGYFQTISQSLAAIIGFLFVFLALALQFIGLERSRMYDYFRDKVEKLNSLSRNCPSEIGEAKLILLELSKIVENLTSKKQIVTPEDIETKFVPLGKRLREIEIVSNSIDAKLFVQEVLSVFVTMEEVFSRNRGAYVGSILLPLEFSIFPKLLILFVLSIFFALAFGTIDVGGYFPDIDIPLLAANITYFGLLLIEVYVIIQRTFKSLVQWK